MNLMISKGEICAYQWGNDQITHGVVDIPAAPGAEAARQAEQDYLGAQTPEMERRYQRTLERVGSPVSA